ncbi:MAG: hypothetical protein JWO58_3107 [Chitinophagaceae bacterium]|nr:hypothetical protein [Chitinophagaceae bacterium]
MPMKKKVNVLSFLYVLFSVLVMTGCKAIIEEDISDKKVIVDAPVSDSLVSYNQLFWWETVDGALKYQVQIATPTFDSIQQLKLDTLVTSNKFTYTLASGRYEWRVRAVNGSYQTAYNGSKFRIYDADLNTQSVVLRSPGSGVSVSSVSLSWNAIPVQGIIYQVQIDKQGTFTTNLFLNTQTQLNPLSVPSITDETTYYWRVRAFKGSDTTSWSLPSSFVYDVTPPIKVTLTSPALNATNNPLTGSMTWTSLGAGVKYTVFVTYGTAPEVQYTVNSPTYTYTGSSGDTVKWRVQAVDQAGNVGTVSDTWSFKIQ